MAGHRTQAFVLKTQDYRDTSLLGAFFTRDFGKVRAVIKGGRDGRARYGSTLEPFSLNEIVLYHRRRGDLDLVTAAELLRDFAPLRRDLGRLGRAAYFIELVDQMTETGLSNPQVFDLLAEALDFLGRTGDPKRVARIFEIRLMQELGFMPYLAGCVRCGAAAGDTGYFSISSGGIICPRCLSGEGPLVPMTERAARFLNETRTKPFAELGRSEIPADTAEKIERTMRQFVDYHLEYKPRSLVFLEKVGAA